MLQTKVGNYRVTVNNDVWRLSVGYEIIGKYLETMICFAALGLVLPTLFLLWVLKQQFYIFIPSAIALYAIGIMLIAFGLKHIGKTLKRIPSSFLIDLSTDTALFFGETMQRPSSIEGIGIVVKRVGDGFAYDLVISYSDTTAEAYQTFNSTDDLLPLAELRVIANSLSTFLNIPFADNSALSANNE